MRVQLLVSDDCEPCRLAETIWRDACIERAASFETIDLASPAGAALGYSLELRSLPAVLIDGKLVAIGVQNKQQIDTLLDTAE